MLDLLRLWGEGFSELAVEDGLVKRIQLFLSRDAALAAAQAS